MELPLREVLGEGLEGTEGIYKITLRGILHDLIQPVAALEFDSKSFDCIHGPEGSNQRNPEDSHRATGGEKLLHQQLIGSRCSENPDARLAMLFRQMLTHEEKLLVKHQIVGFNHFFRLKEGIADLLVQLGMIFVAQEIRTAVGNSFFPVVGHEIGHLITRFDQLLRKTDGRNHMAIVGQIDKQDLHFSATPS